MLKKLEIGNFYWCLRGNIKVFYYKIRKQS